MPLPFHQRMLLKVPKTATWRPPTIKSVYVWTGHRPHCNKARTHFSIYYLGQAIRLTHFLFPDLCPCPPKWEKWKAKEQKQCLQEKLQILLWKLDFLFWSLHDSHFEVVGVFKLTVGSIFFGLWLFPLVLCSFFSLICLSLLFLSFFLPSCFWWVFTSISGETEAACWGARTEMEKTASLAATHSSVTPIPRLRGHTPLWNTDRKSETRWTREKDGRGKECGTLLIKGCCHSVFWSRDNSHKLFVLSNLLRYYIKDSLN